MGISFIALALLGLSAAAGSPRAALTASCPDHPTAHLAGPDGKGHFRKLGDLPPGRAYAAVYRLGPDGCMIPVLYRERQTRPAPRR